MSNYSIWSMIAGSKLSMPQRDVKETRFKGTLHVVAELWPTELLEDHVQSLSWFAKSLKMIFEDVRISMDICLFIEVRCCRACDVPRSIGLASAISRQ